MNTFRIALIASLLLGGHIVTAQSATSGQAQAPQIRQQQNTINRTNSACAASAVGVREDALISAHNKRNTAITTALAARKMEFQSAWGMTENGLRRSTREAAWKKFQKAAGIAKRDFRTAAELAYTNFNNAIKACGIGNYTESSANDASATQ